MTSVRNRCLKRLRHKAVEKAPSLLPLWESASAEDERMADIVEFVVSHLSEQDRRIFALRFTEGYSYEEIAAKEGISRVAVWKHLSGIIASVKQHFNHKSL